MMIANTKHNFPNAIKHCQDFHSELNQLVVNSVVFICNLMQLRLYVYVILFPPIFNRRLKRPTPIVTD